MRISTPAAAAALAVSALMLTGCVPDITGARRVGPEPTSGATDAGETPEAVDDVAQPPADLTFEAGAELEPDSWTAGWTDVLMATDERFAVSSPDDGNGSWAYLDQQTQCSIAFYQGAITDVQLGADDRESTDNMLAAVLSAKIPEVTAADVTANGWDDFVAQATQEGSVDVRMVGGSDDAGGTWSEFGRMFGTLDTALVVSVDCPAGQDAATEVSDLLGAYLAIAVSPTAG